MSIPIGSDTTAFRNLLKTAPNPNPNLDYLTSLSKPVTSTLLINLTYVPDKLLLLPDALEAYLLASAPRIEEPYEAYAHTFLEDVNNEVVPRWLRIEILAENTSNRRIMMTDHQPKWCNPTILTSID